MRRCTGVILGLAVAGGAIGQDLSTRNAPEAGHPDAGRHITGRCHCGAIAYAARPPIVKCSFCDCRGCQRATGALRVPFVTVLRTGFRITTGKPARFRAASGVKCDAHGDWYFCPSCGTHLYWKGHHGNEIDLFAGTLDDPGLFRPPGPEQRSGEN